jgi:hypothetical protein
MMPKPMQIKTQNKETPKTQEQKRISNHKVAQKK